MYEVAIRAGDLLWGDFAVFLVLFAALMLLSKYLPGRPWIVLIAIIGVIYGSAISHWSPEDKPKLLGDLYPTLTKLETSQLWQFSYWSPELPKTPSSGSSDLIFLKKAAEEEGTGFPIPLMAILLGSLKVSFVAVLETLISARIADNMTGTRFKASPECRGMAVANMVSGALGGTPCTGVLVRTAVNCSSGATHKTS